MNKSHYDQSRPEMVDYIPADVATMLDVGCDTGRFGKDLLDAGRHIDVCGIDPNVDPTCLPEGYTKLWQGLFPQDLGATDPFDCLVFNDVLEHMVDPWECLRLSHDWLKPGGVLVASIPNVRSFRVVQPLLLHGQWRYQETGILDRTHLRFFTRSAMVELFESTGWKVREIEPIRLQQRGRWAKANRLSRSRLEEFVAERYAVIASA